MKFIINESKFNEINLLDWINKTYGLDAVKIVQG